MKKKLLKHAKNWFQVAIKPLVTALDMVGRKNLILDFPESLTEQLNLVKNILNFEQAIKKC